MIIEPNKYYNDNSRNEIVWTIGKLEASAEDEVWIVERYDSTFVLTSARNLGEIG